MSSLKVIPTDPDAAREEPDDGGHKRTGGSQANRIFECRLKLYRGKDGQGYGQILAADGTLKVIPVDTNEYRQWLAGRYFEGCGEIPGVKALKQAHDMVKHCASRAREVYDPAPGFDAGSVGGEPDDAQGKAAELIKILTRYGMKLFHTDDDDDELRAYADIHELNIRKTLPIKGTPFMKWARYIHYKVTRDAVMPEVLKMAIETMAAQAEFGDHSPKRDVSLRVTTDPKTGFIYVDLADDTWKAIEIKPGGWSVIGDPPVRFLRSQAMHPLPVPEKGGSLDELKEFLNIKDPDDILLICGALCCYLRPGYPYPILIFQGEAGSAKSTATKVIRRLIDPNKADLRDPPHKIDDLLVTTIHNHIITVENASSIAPSLSDALCRLATGAGTAKRGLYTNHDEIVINARRPVIMNGIEFSMRDDLARRAVFVELMPIPTEVTRDEETFNARFEEARPRILGALCDAVATGLENIDSVRPSRLPSMADFMRWSIACSRDFAVNKDDFENAYWRNVDNLVQNVIEGDPVSVAVREFAYRLHETEPDATREQPYLDPKTHRIAEPRRFQGTSTELLKRLENTVDDKTKGAKAWPSTGSVLSRRITRAAPTLRKASIEAKKPKRGSSTRLIEIHAAQRPDDNVGDAAGTGDPDECIDRGDFLD